MKKILLSEPILSTKDSKNLIKTLKSGWVSTAGKKIILFENMISKFTKAKYCIACNSGTSALHIALKVLNVRKGDEVLVPSISFIATINAIKYNNANPIFMDVDDNFNIDENKVIEFLKKNTKKKNKNCLNKKTKKKIKAIIIAHIWGGAAKVKNLIKVCRKRNIRIVEDAAESLGSFYKKDYLNNKHTGTVGDIGILSFNGNKIITSGAGGMILTKYKFLEKECRYLINQAKDNEFFLHNQIGYNYKMPNLNASLGISQMQSLKKILFLKRKVYFDYLSIFKNSKIFSILKYSNISTNNNWMVVLLLKKNINKSFIDYLIKGVSKKIQFRKVWIPNEKQKQYTKYQKYKINKSGYLYKNSICTPSSADLTYKEIKYIFNNIEKSYENFINSK